jgi:hypothetical protein
MAEIQLIHRVELSPVRDPIVILRRHIDDHELRHSRRKATREQHRDFSAHAMAQQNCVLQSLFIHPAQHVAGHHFITHFLGVR